MSNGTTAREETANSVTVLRACDGSKALAVDKGSYQAKWTVC